MALSLVLTSWIFITQRLARKKEQLTRCLVIHYRGLRLSGCLGVWTRRSAVPVLNLYLYIYIHLYQNYTKHFIMYRHGSTCIMWRQRRNKSSRLDYIWAALAPSKSHNAKIKQLKTTNYCWRRQKRARERVFVTRLNMGLIGTGPPWLLGEELFLYTAY